MKDIVNLLQKITNSAVKGTKPVSVQTGIMENDSEVNLDQALLVKPTLPKIYEDGIEVHVEGTLNGEPVSGDLVLTRTLKKGDKVKIIKEDGTAKYFIAEQLTS